MDAQVYSKAVTFTEYAKGLEASYERVFVETFTQTSDLLAVMPVKAATAGKFRFDRITQLPTVGNRGFNEAGNESTGKYELAEEGVYIMDQYIKTDRALHDHFGSERAMRQIRLTQIAMAQNASRLIINGDNTLNPRETSGLKKRFATLNASLMHNSAASGGAPLSLTNLDVMRRMVNRPTHWIFPYDLMAYADAAARSPTLTNNMFQQGVMDSELGRKVTTYAGLPILFGYEPDNSPLLLEFNEVGSGGGGAVTGSIYCVSFDMTDEKCMLIEQTPLTVKDEGQLQGVPFNSMHVKWDWGIATPHPRSGARLTSITKAAITA